MACQNTTSTLLMQSHLMFLRFQNGCFKLEASEMRLSRSYFTTEPIKRKGKYMHSTPKKWEKHIKMNSQGQDIPYKMYCNETGVLKVNSVYKQSKNYYPRVYVEECKYIDAKAQ